MAVYTNQTLSSPVASVEFTPVSDGNFSFFTVGKPEQKDLVKTWLGQRMGQEILAETLVDNKPVFVTRGDRSQADLLEALKQEGDQLKLHHESKGFAEGAWMLRSALGMTGQFLQLGSSLMQGKRDWGLFTFAISNITANTVNFIYGSQKSDDINRLHFLKEQVNDRLHQAAPNAQLPDVNDQRAELRQDSETAKSSSQKFNEFMKENSVRVGELGLRYLGAIGLAFPTDRWGLAKDELMANGVKSAYKVSRNSRLDKDTKTLMGTLKKTEAADRARIREIYGAQKASMPHYTSIASMAGKTLALASKPEDAYNPKPKTWLDTMREKFTFHAGGLIEAGAFATLSYDSFKNNTIFIKENKYVPKNWVGEHRDYLGGVGAALFTLAYVSRFWAKYSEPKVNMDELYAHITDGLAQMPQEKLPQLMADTAAFVKDHFKEKHLDFGKVFTQIMTETYRYHQVSLASAEAAKGDAPVIPAKAKGFGEKDTPSHLERLQRETPMAEAQR